MEAYLRVQRIGTTCRELTAFQQAAPEVQVDAI